MRKPSPQGGALRRLPGIAHCVVAGVVLAVAGAVPAAPQGEAPGAAPASEAYYLFSLAQQEIRERDYSEALGHLRSAVAVDPASASLRLELARLYWLLGNRQNGYERQAVQQGEEAARLAPGVLEAERFLAMVYTALASRPSAEPAMLAAAVAHQERALSLALEEERSAEQLAMGKLYQQAGRFGDAAAVLESLVGKGEAPVEAYFWLHRAYADQGDLDRAVPPLRQAIALAPASTPLVEALVDLQERRGDLTAAIAAARDLVALAPRAPGSWRRLAQLLRRAGQPAEALEAYETAEDLVRRQGTGEGDLSLADLALERAETLLEAGRPREALALVREGARTHPDDPRFALALAQLQYRAGEKEDGLATLEQLLKARAGDPRIESAVSDAYLSLGARAERGGKFSEAERLLQRAIDVYPENDSALNYLGYLWADRGVNLEQSVAYIERALRVGGESGAYLDSLGWANFRLGRFDLAEAHLTRAAALSASEPEIHAHLGELYAATGRLPAAIAAWEKALTLSPPDAPAIKKRIEQARRQVGAPP